MNFPWVNVLLLVLLVLQTVTGYFGFTNGREPAAWLLVLHGIGAWALVVLFFLKASIIVASWRRRKRWTVQRTGFVVSLVLLILTLVLGLLWTFDGPLYLAGFSLVSLHIYAAVPLMILMLWHAWQMRFIRRVDGALGRRLFLGSAVTAVTGLVLWLSVGRAKAWAGLAGATRRFTGSYEVGSFTPSYPVVSWIADRPPAVDVATWRLRIEGAVARPLSLSYAELSGLAQQDVTAALDCTGGWYTNQRWRGVAVGDLLAQAGPLPAAASVTVEAVSGYKRRFPLEEAHACLLALGTREGAAGGPYRPLDHGHGHPVRWVAPERRGMEWVKWVAVIRVNETGAWAQSPLPLQ